MECLPSVVLVEAAPEGAAPAAAGRIAANATPHAA